MPGETREPRDSDREALLALLARFGIPADEGENRAIHPAVRDLPAPVTIQNSEPLSDPGDGRAPSPQPIGYSGFFASFFFDGNGRFVGLGIFE